MRVVAAEQIATEPLHDEGLRRAEHLRLGATETVDALFGIADDEDAGRGAACPGIAAEPFVQSLPLQRVGVLEFVDQQVFDACIEPFLHPAGEHGIRQHDQRGPLDVVHVDPAAFALQGCELGDQQSRQSSHALVVQPGVVLRGGRRQLHRQLLRGPDVNQALDLFAELAWFAFLRQQCVEQGRLVVRGQREFQLHPLGSEGRAHPPCQGSAPHR